MRAWLLVLLLLGLPVAGEVPLRIGHSSGFMGELAGALRACLTNSEPGWGFHVSLVDPAADPRTADDLALMRATLAGDFHLSWVRSSALANFHRPWGLLSIPYLFPDLAAVRTWMSQGRLLQSTRGRGLRALAAVEMGPKFFATRRDLPGLAGVNVVVPKDRFTLDFVRELGAVPVPVQDAGKLQATRADACETNPVDRVDHRLKELYPNTLRTDHGLEYAVLVMNERAFARLSGQQQQSLRSLDGIEALRVTGARGREKRQASAASSRADWSAQLKGLRERSLRLIGDPWKALFP